jgi:hypothetical protein
VDKMLESALASSHTSVVNASMPNHYATGSMHSPMTRLPQCDAEAAYMATAHTQATHPAPFSHEIPHSSSTAPGLHGPHIASPLARPAANYSPDFQQPTAGLQQFTGEMSRPPPPMQEPSCARDYPNSPLAMHRGPTIESPVKSPINAGAVEAASYSASTYPPSPVTYQPVARGNDYKPRSPLERKTTHQRPVGMGALPVLGPLPSLSLRQGGR